jgi:hypothetical protein
MNNPTDDINALRFIYKADIQKIKEIKEKKPPRKALITETFTDKIRGIVVVTVNYLDDNSISENIPIATILISKKKKIDPKFIYKAYIQTKKGDKPPRQALITNIYSDKIRQIDVVTVNYLDDDSTSENIPIDSINITKKTPITIKKKIGNVSFPSSATTDIPNNPYLTVRDPSLYDLGHTYADGTIRDLYGKQVNYDDKLDKKELKMTSKSLSDETETENGNDKWQNQVQDYTPDIEKSIRTGENRANPLAVINKESTGKLGITTAEEAEQTNIDKNIRKGSIWNLLFEQGDVFDDSVFNDENDKARIRRFSRTFDDFLDSAQDVLYKTDDFQQETILFNNKTLKELMNIKYDMLYLEQLIKLINPGDKYKTYFFNLLEKIRAAFVNFMDAAKKLRQDEYAALSREQQKSIDAFLEELTKEMKTSQDYIIYTYGTNNKAMQDLKNSFIENKKNILTGTNMKNDIITLERVKPLFDTAIQMQDNALLSDANTNKENRIKFIANQNAEDEKNNEDEKSLSPNAAQKNFIFKGSNFLQGSKILKDSKIWITTTPIWNKDTYQKIEPDVTDSDFEKYHSILENMETNNLRNIQSLVNSYVPGDANIITQFTDLTTSFGLPTNINLYIPTGGPLKEEDGTQESNRSSRVNSTASDASDASAVSVKSNIDYDNLALLFGHNLNVTPAENNNLNIATLPNMDNYFDRDQVIPFIEVNNEKTLNYFQLIKFLKVFTTFEAFEGFLSRFKNYENTKTYENSRLVKQLNFVKNRISEKYTVITDVKDKWGFFSRQTNQIGIVTSFDNIINAKELGLTTKIGSITQSGGRRTRKRIYRKKNRATKKKRFSRKKGPRVVRKKSSAKKRFVFNPVFNNQQMSSTQQGMNTQQQTNTQQQQKVGGFRYNKISGDKLKSSRRQSIRRQSIRRH